MNVKPQATMSAFKVKKSVPFIDQMKDIVRLFDYFSCPVQLLVKRNETHSTLFGGFFTFGIISVTAFYFYSLFDDMINRLRPRALTSILFTEVPERFEMDPKEFFFAFAIQDGQQSIDTYQEYKNQSLFNVDVQQCTKESVYDSKIGEFVNNYTCQSLPTEPCNMKKHIQISAIEEFFGRQNMPALYCIDNKFLDKTPPVLQGTFDNDLYKWISIKVSACNNKTNNNCATMDEIDSKLSAGYFEVFFSDSVSNQAQPDNPYSKIGRTIFSTFSKTYSKEYDVFLRHMKTYTDQGLLGESIVENTALSYSFVQELTDVRHSETFLNVVLRLETKVEFTSRFYDKIQDILGIVGGFWSSISFLGLVLVTPINKLDLQLKMINQIFHFEVEPPVGLRKSLLGLQQNAIDTNRYLTPKTQEPRGRQSLTTKVYSHLKDYIQNRDTANSITNKVSWEREIYSTFKDFLKMDIGKMKLTTCEYITFFISCVKKVKAKKNQINFAIKKMEKEIDLIGIVQKLNELEKLKMLLLSKDQLHLFEFLPRPCIPIETAKQSLEQRFEALLQDEQGAKMSFWYTIHKEKTMYQRAYEALEAYENISQKQRSNEVDGKLIQFLDPNIKRLFDMGHKNKQNELDYRPIMAHSSNDAQQFQVEVEITERQAVRHY